MPTPVKTIVPVRTTIAIHLMIPFVIHVLEDMRTLTLVATHLSFLFLVQHHVKIEEDGLDLFHCSFHFYFLFNLFFYFSIFRTTRVRVDWSRRHISHLMV